MKKIYGLFIYLIFVLILVTPSFGKNISSPKVMLVLDASGSMWGQINSEAKISIARRVIQDLLSDWDDRIELGLSVYGHRRKADCNDIEVLVPVGKDTKGKILSAINTISPKGKTPLSQAVKLAAQSLKYTEEMATVILISDGEETCEADPCALGISLEETGVDFTTHVIGFDVEKNQSAGLECLAKNTGGFYASAKDAGTLKAALETTVVEVKKQVSPPVVTKPTMPAGIKFTALYKMDGPEYKGDINWQILSLQTDLNGKREKIVSQHRGKSGHIFKNLPVGKFMVSTELSDARYIRREFEFSVAPDSSKEIKLPLNIGTVRFDALIRQGGKSFPDDLGWSILDPKKDLSGKQHKLTDFWRVKSGRLFILPVGTWDVTGVFADARYIGIKKQIIVPPAGEEAHEFVFNVARVRFDAKLAKTVGAYGGDIGWSVMSIKKNLSGSRTKLADFWRVKSGSLFWLPNGEWFVKGVVPDFRYITVQQTISLSPGDEVPFEFIFNAAHVKLEVGLSDTSEAHKGDLAWTILSPQKDLAGNHQKLTAFWRYKTGSVVLLPAGEWLVKSFLADYKHVGTNLSLTVSPGVDQSIKAIYNAGNIRIDVTSGDAPWKGQVAWNIYLPEKDLAGNQKKITSGWRVAPKSQTFLPMGNYEIEVFNPDNKAQKGSGSFEIISGEIKIISVDIHQ